MKDWYSRQMLIATMVCCLVVIGLALIQPTTTIEESEPAKFVISSWTHPADQFGQGIYSMSLYENSTGSWVMAYTFYHNTTTQEFDWNASVAVKFLVGVWYNTTLTGKTSTNDVCNTSKVTLEIDSQTQSIYQETNMTYYYRITADYPMFLLVYQYTATDWLPESGGIYTLTTDYEVYYA